MSLPSQSGTVCRPVVYEIISSTAQDLISPAQLNVLRGRRRLPRLVGMALLWELLHLHQLFEAAQIPVIPYKGPRACLGCVWKLSTARILGPGLRRPTKIHSGRGRCAEVRRISPAIRSTGSARGAGRIVRRASTHSYRTRKKFWPNFIPSGPYDIFRLPSTFRT